MPEQCNTYSSILSALLDGCINFVALVSSSTKQHTCKFNFELGKKAYGLLATCTRTIHTSHYLQVCTLSIKQGVGLAKERSTVSNYINLVGEMPNPYDQSRRVSCTKSPNFLLSPLILRCK